jgi:rhamnose utilization protein RhaD (predicted bifunctional aldolase and dehydrogenase)/NAD(P)-dependent dehydrogenase (short-subunit alcohol dehydrogenase family)
MKNRYDEQEAQGFIEAYPHCTPDLALRVYTSRLIGREPDLVLHGGGNTSVKSVATTILGEEMEVIHVKGSGWDLGDIEPEGLPALDLQYLKKLRRLDSLTDEEMVNQFRTNLLDSSAPNPSIETLVHAFLPHKFIDHTHSDAIVTLTNQPDGERLLKEALGEKIGILPFIMPGFPLSKAVVELYELQPDMEALILMNHGIFTFADDARTSYDFMIDYVSRAENFIAKALQESVASGTVLQGNNDERPDPCVVLPLLRGVLCHRDSKGRSVSFSLTLRDGEEIQAALARPDAEELFVSGVLTPDHVIRTKNYPLFLDFTGIHDEAMIASTIFDAVDVYSRKYEEYFRRQVKAKQVNRTMLDTMPRIFLVRGLGIVTAGITPKAAAIAADIAEHTLAAKVNSAAVGRYRELDESFIFDMEYWSLEQAKLGKGTPPPLAGKVALVTGGGGAIACGIGRQLLAAGARLYLTDIDEGRLNLVCDSLAKTFDRQLITPLVMDVTDELSVRRALNQVVRLSGGLDILVPNAGVAHVAELEKLSEEKFRQVMDVNCMGVFQVIKGAIPLFRRQAENKEMTGHIIINSSKNVFAPGAAFGAYSSSKAGAHQLGKIAALELAEIGVRVNMINADAIFDDAGISSGLWDVVGPDRMKARNLDPAGLKEYYRNRNLLKTTVTADHVGHAVVFFASGLTPTTGATLPVDGGVASAFPR